MKVKMGQQCVGEGEPCFIIAEVGSNHDRKIGQAKALIDIAAQSKVDAVKFQLFKAERLVPQDHPAFFVLKSNEFPREWIKELFDYAQDKGLVFLASPFDHEAVDLLEDLGIEAFKFASPEIFDYPLLKYAASRGKAMILSTGMCSIPDIKAALDVIEPQHNRQIVLMHCISLYPTEPKEANLRMMDDMKKAFPYPVGFSDHTMNTLTAVAAVSRGACVIEKHFTVSRSLKGPDHAYALEPDELARMVSDIRLVEQTLGSATKRHLEGLENPELHRKSLAVKEDMAKGNKITEDKIVCLRTSVGISSRDLNKIVGKNLTRDIKRYEVLTDEMLSGE